MRLGPLPSDETARGQTFIEVKPSTRKKYVDTGCATITST
jgi:hypothetical protein